MIFLYSDYRQFLNKYLRSLPKAGRGFKSAMAEVLSCKTSYISQVFRGDADLSIEQAHDFSAYLKFSQAETHYFLLLVQLARAGTKSLKQYYQTEIEKIQTERLRLKNRFNYGTLPKSEDEFKYFSSSDYSLIHILTTIPEFRTREALLEKVKVNPDRLDQVLNFLVNRGLLTLKNGQYHPGTERMHLPDDASIISTHHTNWRIQAIKNCQDPEANDMHYSSVVTISQENFLKIKSMLVKSLEECRGVVKESDSEIPASLCIDFYKVK